MDLHATYDTIGKILSIHAMVHQFLAAALEDSPKSRMTEQSGTLVNHSA